MKGGKPTNVSSSITPKTGERLTDAQMSVNGLQTRITKAVIEMRTAARVLKGLRNA